MALIAWFVKLTASQTCNLKLCLSYQQLLNWWNNLHQIKLV